MTSPARVDYSLTESALSPFPAEPVHIGHTYIRERDYSACQTDMGAFR
jgi:hypothetical protein